jgi:hypothetical protein
MFPVLDLANLRLALVRIRAKGVVLYGFLLYTDLDTALVEYARLGFGELDGLAGTECIIFVIEAPSTEWIDFARRKNSPWLNIINELTPVPTRTPARPVELQGDRAASSLVADQEKLSRLLNFLAQNPELCVFELSPKNVVGARHLLDPQYQIPYNRLEALEVARFFGLKLDEIPCLILFEHLEASEVWALKLGEIETVQQAKDYFRKAFASSDFERILDHARTYPQIA